MSNDKMREEFEAWSADHDYLGGIDLHKSIRGEYADMDLQHAWEAWQASREALVIELPNDVSNVTSKDFEAGRDAVIECIEAAGLKVKP